MRLLAFAQAPKDVDGAARLLAQACGLAPAEARMRLNTGPPYLVARLADDAAARALLSLRAADLPAYEVAEPLPDPAQRSVGREVSFEPGALRVTLRSGATEDFPYRAMKLLLVGMRVARSSSSKTTTTRKLDIGMAVMTSGLKMTKTETKTERTDSEQAEQELLVIADGRSAILSQGGLTFRSLGKDAEPSRLGNFQVMVQSLRQRAPHARFDDRLLRLGRRPPTVIVPHPGGGQSDALDVWSALVVSAAEQGLL